MQNAKYQIQKGIIHHVQRSIYLAIPGQTIIDERQFYIKLKNTIVVNSSQQDAINKSTHYLRVTLNDNYFNENAFGIDIIGQSAMLPFDHLYI